MKADDERQDGRHRRGLSGPSALKRANAGSPSRRNHRTAGRGADQRVATHSARLRSGTSSRTAPTASGAAPRQRARHQTQQCAIGRQGRGSAQQRNDEPRRRCLPGERRIRQRSPGRSQSDDHGRCAPSALEPRQPRLEHTPRPTGAAAAITPPPVRPRAPASPKAPPSTSAGTAGAAGRARTRAWRGGACRPSPRRPANITRRHSRPRSVARLEHAASRHAKVGYRHVANASRRGARRRREGARARDARRPLLRARAQNRAAGTGHRPRRCRRMGHLGAAVGGRGGDRKPRGPVERQEGAASDRRHRGADRGRTTACT